MTLLVLVSGHREFHVSCRLELMSLMIAFGAAAPGKIPGETRPVSSPKMLLLTQSTNQSTRI